MIAMHRCAAVLLILSVTHACTGSGEAAIAPAEQECLALSMYFEARSEGRRGMLAVGWTVMNRIRSDAFPGTPCRVVRQGGEQPPCQFSWWCDGRSDRPRNRESWDQALEIAARLMTDPPADPTRGALFFHRADVSPAWRHSRTRTVRIGSHIFYR